VSGAQNIDWEDMASFSLDGENWLIFGDVGDNRHRRTNCTLYLVAEPHSVPQKAPWPDRMAQLEKTLRFRYEDGPHDCEAIAVDTEHRIVLLATKSPRRKIYQLPLDGDTTGQEISLARLCVTIDANWITAMDISPCGRRAILLTYGDALAYTRGREQTWCEAFKETPRRVHLPPRRQGEAICYGPDGQTLYLTSEKRPTPLIEVPFEASGVSSALSR
jgi:hypothetical protein